MSDSATPRRPDPEWAVSLVEQVSTDGTDSVVAWLTVVCRALERDLGLVGAAVTLSAGGGVDTVAASVGDGRRLAELEFDLGEGPATEALASGRPVLVPLLGGPGGRGWPGYTPAALGAGLRAVHAYPLQVGATRFGSLSLFWDEPPRLGDQDVGRCLVMAELATQRLLDDAAAREDGTLDPDLHGAMAFRSEIYQAQGMVMVALDVSLAAALARMRGHAFQSGRELLDVAVDIVHHQLTLHDDRTIDDDDPHGRE